jgi:3-oxoadipate enol-lactonase
MNALLMQTQTPAPSSGPGAFLEVENGKIYYQECGSGPLTVVLVHDGVLDSAVWNAVWPEFCRQFHTIRYDRRGYGRSPAATQGHFATDDLAALLRHLKVSRAAIVGSSHGGEISINFALDHPEIVQQLVLAGAVVGGMPYSRALPRSWQRFRQAFGKRQRAGRNCGGRKGQIFDRLRP